MSNYKSEMRIKKNKIRRQKEIHRNFLLIIITICLVITFSLSINVFLSNAKSDKEQILHKYYKSIIISDEDTLWSIAREYMNEYFYDSTSDYIKEIKQINSLNSDSINYGEHLIIPYYS